MPSGSCTEPPALKMGHTACPKWLCLDWLHSCHLDKLVQLVWTLFHSMPSVAFVSMHPSHALSNGLGCFGVVVSLCTHCCDVHMPFQACWPLVVCPHRRSQCWHFCRSAKAPKIAHSMFVVVGHSVSHQSQFVRTNLCISFD